MDAWVRPSGGGGVSRVMKGTNLEEGNVTKLAILDPPRTPVFISFTDIIHTLWYLHPYHIRTGGKVFEKAGVNLSVVYGKMPQSALLAATERGVDRAKGMKGAFCKTLF